MKINLYELIDLPSIVMILILGHCVL